MLTTNPYRQRQPRRSLQSLGNDVLLCIFSQLPTSSVDPEQLPGPSARVHSLNPPNYTIKPLKALSAVNKLFRDLVGPMLFRGLTLSGNMTDIMNGAMELVACELVLQGTRKLSIYVTNDYDYQTSPLRIPTEVATFALKLRHLEVIAMLVGPMNVLRLQIAFNSTGRLFTSVNALMLGPHCHWLISLCPNVRTILSAGMFRPGEIANSCEGELIEASRHATYLTRFGVPYPLPQSLQTMTLALQQISSLNLAERKGLHLTDTRSLSLVTSLPILRNFTRLQFLILPDISHIAVGYVRNHPSRGRAMHVADRYMTVSERKREEIAERNVAAEMFHGIPSLQRLQIGGENVRAWKALNEAGLMCVLLDHQWLAPPAPAYGK